RGRRVYALKGMGGEGRPVVSNPRQKHRKGKVPVCLVGTDTAKELLLFSRIHITEDGAPGRQHYPLKYDGEYFKQMVAERAVMRMRAGQEHRVWIKHGPRNEALDLNVYALATLAILDPKWDQLESEAVASREAPRPPKPAAEPEETRQPWVRRQERRWMRR